MWLGYACSLLFIISYWHPPLHIHIHLSNMTPLCTRRRPGSEWSSSPTIVLPSTVPFGDVSPHPLHPSDALRSKEEDQSMDHFHGMWESLLFPWLPGTQPLSSPFGVLGSITAGAHLMWSPHLTSSSRPGAQPAAGTEQTSCAADCCRPFTCK